MAAMSATKLSGPSVSRSGSKCETVEISARLPIRLQDSRNQGRRKREHRACKVVLRSCSISLSTDPTLRQPEAGLNPMDSGLTRGMIKYFAQRD